MQEILTRAGSFVAIIVLGYVLKRIGFFKEEDFGILSKITIRITLPAAIITSIAGREIDLSMLVIPLIGLGGGAVYMVLGYLMNLRSSKEKQAFEVMNLQATTFHRQVHSGLADFCHYLACSQKLPIMV